MTIQTLRIFPDYCVAENVTSTAEVNCSVATSLSESLPNNGEKPNQPKRPLFPKYDYGKIFMKCVYSVSAWPVFINLYWKDGRSGGFCKHKSSSLQN